MNCPECKKAHDNGCSGSTEVSGMKVDKFECHYCHTEFLEDGALLKDEISFDDKPDYY